MKTAIFFLVLMISIFSACSMQKVESQKISEDKSASGERQTRQPVLVELFTSEGCSSCPPADKNLSFLEKEQPASDAEIITLALHVDYWNYLGWKDEFSSALFSQRQELYGQKFKLDSIYTPQMVVDGETEFGGSNAGNAVSAVVKAAKNQKANVEISNSNDKLKIKIEGLSEHDDSTVYLAIAEDNLSTHVKRGENSGRKLEHVSVARELKSLGMIDAKTNSFEIESNLSIQSNWEAKNLKLIVFVQDNTSRKILGVNRIKY
jgi:hypothetical protein